MSCTPSTAACTTTSAASERELMRDAAVDARARARGGAAVSALAELRRTVCELHGELVRNGLVAWTLGQRLGARARART